MRILALLTLMALSGCATAPLAKAYPRLRQAEAARQLSYKVSCLETDEQGVCTVPKPHWIRLRDFDCRYEVTPDQRVRAVATCTFTARVAERQRGPFRPYRVNTASFLLMPTLGGELDWRLD
jgi:hypothetical protein